MLHDLITKAASEDPTLLVGGSVGGGALLMFFLKDFFKRTTAQSDTSAKAITALTKDVGLLEAARDRAKEKDEEHTREIAELQKELRDVRETVLVMKAKAE